MEATTKNPNDNKILVGINKGFNNEVSCLLLKFTFLQIYNQGWPVEFIVCKFYHIHDKYVS